MRKSVSKIMPCRDAMREATLTGDGSLALAAREKVVAPSAEVTESAGVLVVLSSGGQHNGCKRER